MARPPGESLQLFDQLTVGAPIGRADADIHAGVRAASIPARFVPVHRSAIVDVSCIREMQPWFKGDYVITMRDGARITSGRSFHEAVRRLLGR